LFRPHNASEDRPRYRLEACGCPWAARHDRVQPLAVAPTVGHRFSDGSFAITDGLGVEFAPAIWICAVEWSPCPSSLCQRCDRLTFVVFGSGPPAREKTNKTSGYAGGAEGS